jgi:hypothetical protein
MSISNFKRAIKKYGFYACLEAADLNRLGNGDSTISEYLGLTFNQSCAAISAGQWLPKIDGDEQIKNCRVAWIPKKGEQLTARGVEAVGGRFIDGNFTYYKAGEIAASMSLNNDASGDYIAVYE